MLVLVGRRCNGVILEEQTKCHLIEGTDEQALGDSSLIRSG